MWYDALLPKLLSMSLTGGIVILAVLAARLCLRRAPKVFSYVLWAAVLFRLLCPLSLTSGVSLLGLVPSPAAGEAAVEHIPGYDGNVEADADAFTPPAQNLNAATQPQEQRSEPSAPASARLSPAPLIWLAGAAALLTYSLLSLARLRRRLSGAAPLRENIYLSEHISSPFVIGLFRPRIYLPAGLTERERVYIIEHERYHIRRLDPVVKLLFFAALCLHWFNPLVWLAFSLCGTDMEMSCDEHVMAKLGGDVRADYSASLLSLSTGRRIIAGAPLAFGEGGAGARVRNILSYRKPALWIIIAALAAVAVLIVCLVTNPKAKETPEPPFDGRGTFLAGYCIAQEPGLWTLSPNGHGLGTLILDNWLLSVVQDGAKTFDSHGSSVTITDRDGLYRFLEDLRISVYEEYIPEFDELVIYRYYASEADYPTLGNKGTAAYSIYAFDGVPAWFAQEEPLRLFMLEPVENVGGALYPEVVPFAPEDIRDLVSAEYVWDTDANRNSLTDAALLGWLEKELAAAEKAGGGSIIGEKPLYLTRSDGTVGVIYPSRDEYGGIFTAKGESYRCAVGNHNTLMALFDLQWILPIMESGDVGDFIACLPSFNWRLWALTQGAEPMELMESLYAYVRDGGANDAMFSYVMEGYKGLDGACAEGYASIIEEMCRFPATFVKCFDALPEESRDTLVKKYMAFVPDPGVASKRQAILDWLASARELAGPEYWADFQDFSDDPVISAAQVQVVEDGTAAYITNLASPAVEPVSQALRFDPVTGVSTSRRVYRVSFTLEDGAYYDVFVAEDGQLIKSGKRA